MHPLQRRKYPKNCKREKIFGDLRGQSHLQSIFSCCFKNRVVESRESGWRSAYTGRTLNHRSFLLNCDTSVSLHFHPLKKSSSSWKRSIDWNCEPRRRYWSWFDGKSLKSLAGGWWWYVVHRSSLETHDIIDPRTKNAHPRLWKQQQRPTSM